MNDLINLPPSSPPSRQTWNDLSGALKAQLLDGRSDLIESSPNLLAECERAIPVLRHEASRGSTSAEIIAVLSKRFALFPQPDRTDGEWTAWWADYIQALEDMPPAAIEAGMAEYVRQVDSEFFPKPGRVRELARTVPNKMVRACQIAEWAVRRAADTLAAEETRVVGHPEPTEAEKASIRTMLASFQREMAARAPIRKKPELPPISGPTDDRGLTQAMRDLMAAQA